jgi:DNA (cytosine-5)-methyltransferase 1
MTRPKLLDLFCGAGGAGMGYYRAGFDVTGVDIKPQPHYPFKFIQADALTFPLEGYDAYHASPPCQGYSHGVRNPEVKLTPKLIDAIRDRLYSTGKPYVIENVKGARDSLKVIPEGYFVLCGTMFPGERPVRHRLFEARPFIWSPCHQKCLGHNKRLAKRLGVNRRMVEVATVHENVPLWQSLMGINWTTDPHELSEAIPPAYTEYIGKYLMKELGNV